MYQAIFKFFLIPFLFVACEDASTPEKVIEIFAKKKLAGESKSDLSKYMTDSFKENYFSDALSSKLKLKRFKVLNKMCEADSCSVTYFLKYLDSEKPKVATEVKKVATLQMVEGVWKINNVESVKTFHEFQDPIPVTNE